MQSPATAHCDTIRNVTGIDPRTGSVPVHVYRCRRPTTALSAALMNDRFTAAEASGDASLLCCCDSDTDGSVALQRWYADHATAFPKKLRTGAPNPLGANGTSPVTWALRKASEVLNVAKSHNSMPAVTHSSVMHAKCEIAAVVFEKYKELASRHPPAGRGFEITLTTTDASPFNGALRVQCKKQFEDTLSPTKPSALDVASLVTVFQNIFVALANGHALRGRLPCEIVVRCAAGAAGSIRPCVAAAPEGVEADTAFYFIPGLSSNEATTVWAAALIDLQLQFERDHVADEMQKMVWYRLACPAPVPGSASRAAAVAAAPRALQERIIDALLSSALKNAELGEARARQARKAEASTQYVVHTNDRAFSVRMFAQSWQPETVFYAGSVEERLRPGFSQPIPASPSRWTLPNDSPFGFVEYVHAHGESGDDVPPVPATTYHQLLREMYPLSLIEDEDGLQLFERLDLRAVSLQLKALEARCVVAESGALPPTFVEKAAPLTRPAATLLGIGGNMSVHGTRLAFPNHQSALKFAISAAKSVHRCFFESSRMTCRFEPNATSCWQSASLARETVPDAFQHPSFTRQADQFVTTLEGFVAAAPLTVSTLPTAVKVAGKCPCHIVLATGGTAAGIRNTIDRLFEENFDRIVFVIYDTSADEGSSGSSSFNGAVTELLLFSWKATVVDGLSKVWSTLPLVSRPYLSKDVARTYGNALTAVRGSAPAVFSTAIQHLSLQLRAHDGEATIDSILADVYRLLRGTATTFNSQLALERIEASYHEAADKDPALSLEDFWRSPAAAPHRERRFWE